MVSDISADRDCTALALCQSHLLRGAFFETCLTLLAIKGILSFWPPWEEQQAVKEEADSCMANTNPWGSAALREQKVR